MKKIKIYAIVGKSGSGKDYLLKKTLRNINANEIISCTSRPPREGEIDGKNYHFVTSEYFLENKDEFIEYTIFNDWYYGTRYCDLDEDKPNIGVFNPEGIESLSIDPRIDLYVIRVVASDKIRLIRQLQREENPDIIEIFRRYNTDNADFIQFDNLILPRLKPDRIYCISNNTNNGIEIVYDIVNFIKKAEKN